MTASSVVLLPSHEQNTLRTAVSRLFGWIPKWISKRVQTLVNKLTAGRPHLVLIVDLLANNGETLLILRPVCFYSGLLLV